MPERRARPSSVIGIDLGVKTLLTGVDNNDRIVTVAGPKALRSSLRKLRRAGRAHSRKAKGGANRRKAAARLARVHARVANVRSDALHKATSSLAICYGTVVVEDLNVTGMLANRKLARAVADQGFGEARRQLGYKMAWNGGQILVADRWYPSSKTCSTCRWRKPSLTLAERMFTCEACGLVMDRDVNAARNLLKLAASGAESLNACGAEVRPGPAGHTAVKQEPGTANASQTGTVPRQHGTAA
jgi:putative transposase